MCSVMKTCHVQCISAKHQKKKPIPKDRLEKVRMGACAVMLSLCLDRWFNAHIDRCSLGHDTNLLFSKVRQMPHNALIGSRHLLLYKAFVGVTLKRSPIVYVYISLLFGSKNIKKIDNKQRTCYTIIEVILNMPNLGDMIKEKREAVGLSQKKLAEACSLSDSEIMKIESGRRETPSWKNLCKIAKALDFHPFEILLAAGYITEEDISPSIRLRGLDKLDEKGMATVQLFIDFIISRKDMDGLSKGGL